LIRTDILHERKGIHIKLKKDVHLKLREKLFHHQLSMQWIFDEFARLIINEDKRAMKIIEDLALRRARESLEKPVKKSIEYNRGNISELDHNTLYNMISADDPGKRKPEDEDETV
jgi:hypothetical protein